MIENYFNSFSSWISFHPQWVEITIFFIAMGESLAVIGLVIPGVALMFAVGALIGTSVLPFAPICFWATVGAITGDSLSFCIGRYFQTELKQFWPFRSYPWMIERGLRFFHKYGGRSLIFGRFFGPVRGVIPLVVGMLDMHAGRFFVISVCTATVWAPAYLLPGMVFGASLELASRVAGRLVVFIILIAVLFWLAILLGKKIYLFCQPFALGLVVVSIVFGFLYIEDINLIKRDTDAFHQKKFVTQSFWWNKGWKLLSNVEENVIHRRPRSLTIQWSASLADIHELFAKQGWAKPPTLNVQNALHWLNPEVLIGQTPILPQFRQNKQAALVLIKPQSDFTALVLRLWPSDWVIEGTRTSLWIGKLSYLEQRKMANFLYLSEEVSVDARGLAVLESALKAITTPAGFFGQTVSLNPPIILLALKQE